LSYVIDGPKILKLSAIEIGKADTLLVRQNLTTYSFEKGTRLTKATETIRYIFPNIFRTDQEKDDFNSFFIAQDDRTLAVVNNQADPRAENELDLYHYLLLQHRSQGLIRLLEAYGIDTAVSSLGKYEKKPAYVIGVKYPNENQSQLWIDKESFLPMRWILVVLSQAAAPAQTASSQMDSSEMNSSQADLSEVDPSQADSSQTNPDSVKTVLERLEFRFALWRQFDRLQYPMRITVLQNGILVREIQVADVKMNPYIDKALVNIDQQEKLFPEVKQPQIEQQEYDDSTDDIQKTIDYFKKKFE
jgi:hypothetical protein